MFDMMTTTYELLMNYVFGNNIYTIMALLFLVVGFMVFKGFSFDAVIITLFGLLITGGVWIFPQWTLSLLAIIVFFIVGYVLFKYVGR